MFFGTSQVESTNQGSKYMQGYFDKEYAITNPLGVTQNLDFTGFCLQNFWTWVPSGGRLPAGR